MDTYITGNAVKTLREKKGYTQKQLADILSVSDKAISKWETERGLPDISLIEPLAFALGVSLTELLSGEFAENRNRSSNMLRSCFYICPICGNVICSSGRGAFSCCGVSLPVLEAEPAGQDHRIGIEKIETENYITMDHPMNRDHYISFLAYLTADRMHILKLYPEQNAEGRFFISGHGMIYAYCNRHGLFMQKV